MNNFKLLLTAPIHYLGLERDVWAPLLSRGPPTWFPPSAWARPLALWCYRQSDNIRQVLTGVTRPAGYLVCQEPCFLFLFAAFYPSTVALNFVHCDKQRFWGLFLKSPVGSSLRDISQRSSHEGNLAPVEELWAHDTPGAHREPKRGEAKHPKITLNDSRRKDAYRLRCRTQYALMLSSLKRLRTLWCVCVTARMRH